MKINKLREMLIYYYNVTEITEKEYEEDFSLDIIQYSVVYMFSDEIKECIKETYKDNEEDLKYWLCHLEEFICENLHDDLFIVNG